MVERLRVVCAASRGQCRDVRMTEKRRLAIAAPAIKKRMMVLKRALVLWELTASNAVPCFSTAMARKMNLGHLDVDGGGSHHATLATEDSLDL